VLVAAILLALGSALVYGVGDYCGGRATRTEQALAVVVRGQLFGALTVLVAIPFLGDPVAPPRDWLIGGVGGMFGAIGLTAFYPAMSRGPMTVVAPVTAVVSAVTPVIWGLVRGERPGVGALVGIVVALCSIALVSGFGGFGGSVAPRTIVLSVFGGFGFAATFIALSETSVAAGLWPLVAARCASVSLIGGIILATRRSFAIARPIQPVVAAGGVMDMSANILYLFASRRGLLSIVAVITSLYPTSTVALAFGLDKERLTKSQGVGLLLAAAALVLVTIG
jgi:drug/metabolite transporter (DMT)-like permease